MSATPDTDPTRVEAPAPSKASKKKKSKKKSTANAKLDSAPNGAKEEYPDPDADDGVGEGEDDVDEPQSPSVWEAQHPMRVLYAPLMAHLKSPPLERPRSAEDSNDYLQKKTSNDEESSPKSNGAHVRSPSSSTAAAAAAAAKDDEDQATTSERLDALAKERDSLREEVTQLRKSLETIQSKHEEERTGLQTKLDEAASGKEHAENQYRDLRGKVNTIRSQLGERMKADAEELERSRAQIDDLEEQNRSVREENDGLSDDLASLRTLNEEQAAEIANLRGRANLSQQNWVKERDELIQREAYAREEFETAKQAMQDWEVLAMEERSLRENLGDRVTELEEQLSAQREALERAVNDRDTQTSTVDGLQRALRDIQDARKKELREIVENSQSQVDALKTQLAAAEEASASAKSTLEATQKELERALPFEKEVKEKNLLIGKLRHEAVILNDHLTKALRILKKGRPEDNVDRQIVTNHLLHFLALDRSDPKKFQVLQLIAALLGWNEEQREQAGLARPGSTNSNLRIPLSPFRRTPSTPSLNTDLLLTDHSSNKESLAELWQNFLEQEALEGKGGSANASRRGSGIVSPTNTTGAGDGKGLGILP